jgi:hypothetical protein
MSGTLTNKQRKGIVGDLIKAERARIQASIDACNARRDENRRKRQELADAQEKSRIRQLANLTKKMVFMFAMIDGQIVILSIVDPSLIKSSYSVGMKHHITYGSPDYEKIHMKASYSPRGKRSERIHQYSYTVSTADGFNFDIIDMDGKISLSFQSLIQYESLVGTSVSGVQFDQFWYDPFKGSIDDETAKFHAELDRLIQADADYVSKNPKLLEEGYVPYFRFGF